MTERSTQASILSRKAFEDRDLFEIEQRLVGEQCWALIGPAEWVAAEGAWMTGRIAGREVFVQRFGDRLVGFENVCSHRFAELRATRRGTGPIQCPYHGWMFNAQGVPVGIPHCRELFGVAPHQLADRRLRPIEIVSRGHMVFGCLPEAGRSGSFERALGRWSALFDALNGRAVELFSDQEQTIKANWKLGFQNTLDDYHIVAVHPKSFGSFGWLAPNQFRYESDSAHHAMVTLRRDGGVGTIHADTVVDAIGRGAAVPVDYAVFHYFPDLLIGFVNRRVVMVTRYEAMGVGETRVRTYLFDLLPSGGAALNAATRKTMATYIGTILEEDRQIVERWSKGMKQAWAPPLHGLQEQRLSQFERSWAALFPAAPAGALVGS